MSISLMIILLLGIFIGCDSKKNVIVKKEQVVKNVKFYTVTKQLNNFKRLYPCVMYGSKRVKLAFQVSGELKTLNVKRGEKIKKGFLIATLDSRKKKNDLDAATAQLTQREKDYHRQKALTEKNVVSKSFFEEAKRNYEIAKAHFNNAQKVYDDTFLKAPFAGVVTELYVENYQYINAKEAILYLQDVETLEARVDLPESDVARTDATLTTEEIHKKYNPMITFAVYKNKTFPLTIKEFEVQGDLQTQTFRATFLFNKPANYSLYPGMTAWITLNGISFEADKLKGYYAVPVEAVIEKKLGQKAVWIVNEDMTVTFKEVSAGMLSGNKIFIKGVNARDVLVASGANYINSDDKVKELARIGNKLQKGTSKNRVGL